MEGDRELVLPDPSSGLDGDDGWPGGPGLIAALKRYRLVIVSVTLCAALVGVVVSLLLPARYEAQAGLYLRDPGSPSVLSLNGSSQSQGDHTVFMATQAGLARSDEVFGRASQLLQRGGTPDDIRSSVVVAPSADLASITIRASSDSAGGAADLANAIGTAYQQVAGEHLTAESKDAVGRLQPVMDQRNAELDSLRAQLAHLSGAEQATVERKAQHVADLIGALQVDQDQIVSQAALYGSGVQFFQRAAAPVSSSQPAPPLLALSGAVLGLIAASGWAWWAAGRNRRVEAEGDAGAILGVPLLGETPHLSAKPWGAPSPSPPPPDELDPTVAESYHVVLAALEHALSKLSGKVVAVASAGPGDGKTVTALNLAIAAKREGRKVLLVDADERTRRLSQLCHDGGHFDVVGVSHDGGDCPAVTDQVALGGEGNTAEAGGTVLTIGPIERNGHHPAVFFRSTAFGKLIRFSGTPADLVLIDTPALLVVSEAVTIADHADAIVLVVNRGTSLADLRRARERLAFTDTPLIGYLLNRGPVSRAHLGDDSSDPGSLVRGLLRRRGLGKLVRQVRAS